MRDHVIREYLLLGLRLGKLVNGFVDCWFGDPELLRQVHAEPVANPTELTASAIALRDELLNTDLPESRQEFLSAQLTALACTARRLAGEQPDFRAEVRDYFQVQIDTGELDHYASVHQAIAELLPGAGSLRARLAAYYERNTIPPDKLGRAVQAMSDELRVRVRQVFGLPAGERVEYEVVQDRPWNAFNRYLGDFRSTVAINVEAGRAIAALPTMVTHESYPGHHTDHCVKEAELVRGRGYGEQVISLVNTPQCLISEGMAELALDAMLGDGWGKWTAEVLAEQGVHTDGEFVERLLMLLRQLLPARQDAAILIHQRGADVDDVIDYLRRWLLLPTDRARHMVSFLTDPLWRAYTVTYIEGARLVGAWLAARPAGQSMTERYQTLLREPLLPAALRAELNPPAG